MKYWNYLHRRGQSDLYHWFARKHCSHEDIPVYVGWESAVMPAGSGHGSRLADVIVNETFDLQLEDDPEDEETCPFSVHAYRRLPRT